mmetsp:Transcript_9959/g.22214  ORF Transcript_9959/g.22214 Transcript_9959/m.22214 type:complete len:80 (+) Transcript_9959:531-770(+)
MGAMATSLKDVRMLGSIRSLGPTRAADEAEADAEAEFEAEVEAEACTNGGTLGLRSRPALKAKTAASADAPVLLLQMPP